MGYTGSKARPFEGILKEYPDLDLSHFNKRPYRRKNKIGEKYGKLTIIGFDEERIEKEGKTYVFAKCDCPLEKVISVRPSDLMRGNTLSCGCLRQKLIIGKQYGKLTITSYNEEKTKETHHSYVNVFCSCNPTKQYVVRTDSILSGKVVSCGCERQSALERKVEEILNNLFFPYKKEYSFDSLKSIFNIPLRFDFYLPKQKILIECQGKQHYEPIDYFGGEESFKKQLENDNLKRRYCKENNIKLIEIPYWDYDIINEEYLLNLLN